MKDVPIVLGHSGIHSHGPVKRDFSDGTATMIKAGIKPVGENHVSLRSDFDGSVASAFDMSGLSTVTGALLRAVLTKAQCAKFTDRNILPVLRARLE